MTATLAQLRSELELMLSLGANDSYAGSANELRDIQRGYEATVDKYDLPHLLRRTGIVLVANLDRYSLPTRFRKARTVKLLGKVIDETELEFLKETNYKYSIDQQQADIILKPIPSTASTAFTLSNAESAGNAVTIELDTVSGLTALEEIFIDSSGTDEFTMISSISSANTTITARLDAAKSASDILYRVSEILDILYYQSAPKLSASTDTLLLPDSFDFVILHYAASVAFERLEEFDRAKQQLDLWEKRGDEAFKAYDQNSTGQVTQFSVF